VELLLKFRQITKLLNVSVRTVYVHSISLGDFYTVGIKALR
jgi:hypothetical protein